VLVPVPVVVPPGERVNVQVPVGGKPFNTTLPVATLQVGWVIVPIAGADGTAFTVNVYVAVAAVHGVPNGLLVVTVMVTTLPASAAIGVYVKSNGEVVDEDGLTDPEPFSVIVTLVAPPPNVLALTVTGVVPQELPLVLLKVTAGGFKQPHVTGKLVPVVSHPEEFLTVIV
jgi:hypothetical protein